MSTIKEADLYLPIKAFFIENDYDVSGEVKHVDLVAKKEDDIIAVELKKAFNLKLLLQAVDRQKYFQAVYVAIEKPKYSKRNKEIVHMLKRLEIGLITVNFLKSRTDVVIEHHPIPFNRQTNYKKKRMIIEEVNNRTGLKDNIGGTTGVKQVTVYRENAIGVAYALSVLGDTAPKHVKGLIGLDKAGAILYQNHYGWFDRIDQGVYRLNKKGRDALLQYPKIVEYYRKKEGTNETD